MSTFTGKVALVTVGTSGLGRTTAIAFAQQGANVVIVGRSEADSGSEDYAVLFLGSDAASFITGHPLSVDGGYVAQ